MTEKDLLTKTLTDTLLTRRSFLKWSAALGGTAALAGGLSYGLKTVENVAAASEGKWVTVACPMNCSCGNSRCLIQAYIVDGMPVKVRSDENDPDSPDMPQRRACPRGRAFKQHVLAADRLKFPMKRKNWAPGGGKKELRGRDEWVRISWDEALDIVASETKRIYEKYGPSSCLPLSWAGWSQGGGSEGYSLWDPVPRVFAAMGGYTCQWGIVSWGGWILPELFMSGQVWAASDRMSLRHAKLIVLFGANWQANKGGNVAYHVKLAKEAGARVIVVDPWYNQTAKGIADKWIPVRPGTDTAMLLAIAHEMIVNGLQDQAFLDTYTVGFDRAHMPEGADPKENFKDYVLGTYDKIPKTPEWASQICGTDPAEIRLLAWEMATTKPATFIAGQSVSKIPAGEQVAQAFFTLGWMTGNVGLPGASVSYYGPDAISVPLVNPGPRGDMNPGNPLYPPKVVLTLNVLDPNQKWSALNWNTLWDDILAGEYGLDSWPGGKRKINIQMIYHGTAHMLNSLPGATKGIEVHRKVEFVAASCIAFNSNARYADVVFPIDTQWERGGELFAAERECIYYVQKAMDSLFESKPDTEVLRGLAERLGFDPDVLDDVSYPQREYNTIAGATVAKSDGSGFETLVTITADDIKAMGVEGKPQQGRLNLQEFKEKGIYKVPRTPDDKLMFVLHKAFREDPIANPLATSTGKLEIYCPSLSGYINALGYSKLSPIAKYQVEDPEQGSEAALKSKEYPLILFTPHSLRRAHTVFDNEPNLREAFPQECFMSIVDAEARGIKTGDTVLMTSPHGKVLRRAKVLHDLIPGSVALQDGAWMLVDENTGIDMAGCPNTLQHLKPTGEGHQPWTGTLLQVEKYNGEALAPDSQWPPRTFELAK
jgi:anaerobic dimethyl sulfoxide reductase subunit A